MTLNTTAFKECFKYRNCNAKWGQWNASPPGNMSNVGSYTAAVTNPCSIFPCLGRAEMGGGVHHKDVTLWWPEPYCAAEQRIVNHGAPIVDKSLLSYVALPTRQTWKRCFWQGFAIGTFVLYSPFHIPSNIFALLVCRIHTNKSKAISQILRWWKLGPNTDKTAPSCLVKIIQS